MFFNNISHQIHFLQEWLMFGPPAFHSAFIMFMYAHYHDYTRNLTCLMCIWDTVIWNIYTPKTVSNVWCYLEVTRYMHLTHLAIKDASIRSSGKKVDCIYMDLSEVSTLWTGLLPAAMAVFKQRTPRFKAFTSWCPTPVISHSEFTPQTHDKRKML